MLALILRRLLNPLLGVDNPYHTAWLAVMFSAWYCGIGPSILALIVSVAGVWYWFLPPSHSLTGKNHREFVGMLGFLALGAVVIALGESTRRNIGKREEVEEALQKTHDELEIRVRERTADLAERTKELEQKSAEVIEQARMLDLANDAIFVRTAGDTISYWNEGAERLYGWTKQEVLGQYTHELLHTVFPIPVEQVKSRETWEGELLHTKRDGTQIMVASRWRTLRDQNGNASGWLEINTDITSRKQAEEAARSLSGRILTMQDDERRRIARGLHDSLGQYLAALKMNLDIFPSMNNEQSKILSDCSNILSQCLAETRTISHLLHPPLLDESGLELATRLYVDEFARRSSIAVNFEAAAELLRLHPDLEIALFRAVQEGLTNVHRHSGASSVKIRLTQQGSRVRLEIRDNGRGMPQEQLDRFLIGVPEGGVGLAGMRERLRELGGSLDIQTSSAGTTLIIHTPLTYKENLESGVLAS